MADRNEEMLVLASNSERRRQLLMAAGYRIRVIPPTLSEPPARSLFIDPVHWAEALSYFKASCILSTVEQGFILAADTIVVMEDVIFGKPRDRSCARNILQTLSGTTHQVVTGVTLLESRTRARWIEHDVTEVSMRPMTEETIENYLDTGLWQGKAGAYGIQDRSDANIERVVGSYTNVVGLPMERVTRMLNRVGIEPCPQADR